MQPDDLYMHHALWKRLPHGACVRYTVLHHLGSGRYAVQSADFFTDDDPAAFTRFERQFVELLREQCPLQRCHWFDSIEKAVQAHDQDFAGQVGTPWLHS
ncbi:hypothetical protein C1926_17860 [Stenotrophomonas sp. ZAC14A_NAIMI4_1]|nr:hypothetical protein C1926_17860 [Stenotrophomonas sp. ZAC14A_NAIMI4_1]